MVDGSETLTLVTTAPAAGGDAIARDDSGRVVFVAGALPGERVEVAITTKRRDYAKGHVLRVLEPSANRVEPPCPLVAAGCGGCDLQHLAVGAQPAFKAAIVEDALRRLGRVAEPAVTVADPLPATGYRTTVRVGIVRGRAGFRLRRRHDLLRVESCLVAHPGIDELLHGGAFGDADEATIRVGGATGERLVLVEPDASGVAGLPEDVVVIGRDQLTRGAHAAYHDEVAGRRFRIGASSFFQGRTDGAAALVDEVRRAATGMLEPGVAVVDAYAGVGLFAATLVPDDAGKVTVIEWSTSAVADARHNLAELSDSVETTITRTDVAEWTPAPADLVIADPSRRGLARGGVDALTATGAARLVLVSCDAAALGRDAGLLQAAGWRLVEARLVDVFPHTHHVEVVSRFDRH